MDFPEPLQKATLIKRYKRFLADVKLESGDALTVHCPNTGSMMGCSDPGSEVMISRSPNPKRKYPHTLEMVRANDTWVGINTSLTNRLVRDGIENGIFPELIPFSEIKPEVKVGKSRLDFLLTNNDKRTFIEVKNCTLIRERTAMFPDAVTTRGTKHLHELMELIDQGHRGALIFCIQREDADTFTPAADIDPTYAATLAEAASKGVMILACQTTISPASILITEKIPTKL